MSLDGTASSDADGDPLSYAWTQVAGPSVILDDPTAAQPSFWTQVDRRFDLEDPDWLVDGFSCHSYCETSAPVIEVC